MLARMSPEDCPKLSERSALLSCRYPYPPKRLLPLSLTTEVDWLPTWSQRARGSMNGPRVETGHGCIQDAWRSDFACKLREGVISNHPDYGLLGGDSRRLGRRRANLSAKRRHGSAKLNGSVAAPRSAPSSAAQKVELWHKLNPSQVGSDRVRRASRDWGEPSLKHTAWDLS
ncbi:hypothetical protein VTK56DRAFT_7231 [Thermocarpiscus australiensis]